MILGHHSVGRAFLPAAGPRMTFLRSHTISILFFRLSGTRAGRSRADHAASGECTLDIRAGATSSFWGYSGLSRTEMGAVRAFPGAGESIPTASETRPAARVIRSTSSGANSVVGAACRSKVTFPFTSRAQFPAAALARSVGRLPAGPVAPVDLDHAPGQKVSASPVGVALDLLRRFEEN